MFLKKMLYACVWTIGTKENGISTYFPYCSSTGILKTDENWQGYDGVDFYKDHVLAMVNEGA